MTFRVGNIILFDTSEDLSKPFDKQIVGIIIDDQSKLFNRTIYKVYWMEKSKISSYLFESLEGWIKTGRMRHIGS